MRKLHLVLSILTCTLFVLRYTICCLIHLKLNGLTFVTSQEMISYIQNRGPNFLGWLENLNRLHEKEVERWWSLSGKLTSLYFLCALSMNLDKIFKYKLYKTEYSKSFINIAITFAIGDVIDRIWFNINTFTWNDYIVILLSVILLIKDIVKIKKGPGEAIYAR